MKYEKILLAVPTQACPDIPLPEDEQKSRYERRRYCFFAAQKMTLGGEDFLGVTVFDRNKKPLRRWWLTSRQSGMQAFEQVKSNYNRRYERETRHMYETAIDTELHTGPLWSYTRDVLVGTDEDRRLVQSFIGTAEDDVGDAIATFQQAQREVKREKKREAKRSVIRRRFAELPPLPEDLDRWICDGPLLPYRYFYYTYTGKPAQEGICTHCGVESKLENVRTGAQVRCPACGSMLRCRSKKRLPTYGVTDHGKAVLYQQAGDELAVRVFEVRAEIRYDDLTGTTGCCRLFAILWQTKRGGGRLPRVRRRLRRGRRIRLSRRAGRNPAWAGDLDAGRGNGTAWAALRAGYDVAKTAGTSGAGISGEAGPVQSGKLGNDGVVGERWQQLRAAARYRDRRSAGCRQDNGTAAAAS